MSKGKWFRGHGRRRTLEGNPAAMSDGMDLQDRPQGERHGGQRHGGRHHHDRGKLIAHIEPLDGGLFEINVCPAKGGDTILKRRARITVEDVDGRKIARLDIAVQKADFAIAIVDAVKAKMSVAEVELLEAEPERAKLRVELQKSGGDLWRLKAFRGSTKEPHLTLTIGVRKVGDGWVVDTTFRDKALPALIEAELSTKGISPVTFCDGRKDGEIQLTMDKIGASQRRVTATSIDTGSKVLELVITVSKNGNGYVVTPAIRRDDVRQKIEERLTSEGLTPIHFEATERR